MPLVMLRPNWPANKFTRTVRVFAGSGKARKLKSERAVHFPANTPVEVSAEELAALAGDLGNAIFECELDEKKRPRLVESETVPPSETTTESQE